MKHFALFGDPVAHSLSPAMHNSAIAGLGIKAHYFLHHLINGDEIIDAFFGLNLQGANVTVPHKEVAAKLAHIKSPEVEKIKAANTLVLKQGQIHAFNTDIGGFMLALKKLQEKSQKHSIKNALILGAGGTAKAISYGLKNSGIEVSVLNRSAKRLEDFKEFKTDTWESFEVKNFDLIVNTTSAGLKDSTLPAPKDILMPLLKQNSLAFDVIYGRQTPFLSLAKEHNLAYADGENMLLFQAVLAFNIFFENKFNPQEIQEFMSNGLAKARRLVLQ